MLESRSLARSAAMSAVPRINPPDAVPADPALTASETVLAFDFGERFLGVAVGDRALRIAHPLVTIDAGGVTERFSKIGALIDEWRPSLLVVGMPQGADDQPHRLAARIERFSRQLGGRFRLPVRLVDEQFTSVEAERELRDAGARIAGRKALVHPMAARLILESYFNDVAA